MDGEHTVLLSTHMTEDLDRLADYLIYLQKGELLYAGDMESFREKYRIVAGEHYKIKLLGDKVLGYEKGRWEHGLWCGIISFRSMTGNLR